MRILRNMLVCLDTNKNFTKSRGIPLPFDPSEDKLPIRSAQKQNENVYRYNQLNFAEDHFASIQRNAIWQVSTPWSNPPGPIKGTPQITKAEPEHSQRKAKKDIYL